MKFLRKNIDIFFLSSLLLKNKILTFLSIILAFLIIFSFANFEKKNYYTAFARINSSMPNSFFIKAKNYNMDNSIQRHYEGSLSSKIFSNKNFIEFIYQENNIQILEVFKKYNLDLNDYFSKNFKENVNQKIIQYSLNYPYEIDGVSFLNNYIIFSKKKLLEEIYLDFKSSQDIKIDQLLSDLEIATILNIDSPINNAPNQLMYNFSKGKIALSIEIRQLQKKKEFLSTQYFDWDPFVLEATMDETNRVNKKNYPLFFLKIIFGFLLGIFIALLIIIFKNNTKNI